MSKTHPWELAWREGREGRCSVSPPLPSVTEFAKILKREKVERVLDLGCGTGRHAIPLAKAGFHVIGLDVSETALRVLRDRLKKASIPNVTLVKHEMGQLPFIEDYFDAVVCTNVLHHGLLAEVKQTIAEAYRVMKRGAPAFVVTLSRADFRMGTGKKLEQNTYIFTECEERGIVHHFFSRQELLSCLKAFKIVSFKERFIPVEEGGNRAHFLVNLRKS